MKYDTGATGLAGSLGGESEECLSKGYSDVTPKKADPWGFGFGNQEDENGNTQEGDKWEFRNTGAAGRPRGTER